MSNYALAATQVIGGAAVIAEGGDLIVIIDDRSEAFLAGVHVTLATGWQWTRECSEGYYYTHGRKVLPGGISQGVGV